MINTKEDFLNFTEKKAVRVSTALAQELFESTKNAELEKLLGKEKIIILPSLRESIQNRIKSRMQNMETARISRKTSGGRKRLPDLTPEEIEKLSPEAQKTYRMRLWKRESRARLAQSV